MSQQNQNKTDQKQLQHEWYAHVASSPSANTSLPATSMCRSNNNNIHTYESLYGTNSVKEGTAASSCAVSRVGEGGNGVDCMYDLELHDGANSVAYAHNQLLQYQQHQNTQLSQHIPLGATATHLYDASRKENNLQQQMNQYQQTLQNPLAVRSLIEVDELIIKSEPLDENILKSNFIEDTTPYVDFNDEMLNPKIELTVKEETPTDNQQKSLNFPRRKVQTERSETLPICQRCKQVFFKKQVYISHVAESVCDIVEYDFKCGICPMSFMCMEELEKHKQLHRANKFFCHKFCGKYYNTITDCETHEYMHHEYETFVCNICSGTFPTREQLYAHLPLHKFQQRFDCSVCRLWFQTPQELHRHRIGAPYFCGKYYGLSPMLNNAQDSNFQNPLMSKPNMQQHGSYKLQDCRMGVMEMPPHQFQPNPSVSNATVTSGFGSQRSFYQQNVNFHSNNSFFQVPPIKTEVKVESDYYLKSMDYQQQQMTSQNYSDYTNDSYSSSHNSSSFANDCNEAGNASMIAQQTQSSNASALDDSEDAVCCVPHCGVRKSTSPTLQFFTFPKDDKYLHQWLSNLKMLHVPAFTYLNYRICSLHFPKRCINRYSLCYWAVPTFNLGHDDVANLYQNRELTNTFTIGDVARCSMPNCKSQRGESNVKFYNFPKDIKSLIKWCQNARLPVQSKEPRHFCGRHFEERCIGKFRLKPWAVPTLNLGTPFGKIHDNPQNLYVEEKRCCLSFCRRSRSSDFNMSLYRFPRDEVLLQRWCYNLRLDPAVYRGKNHKICSAHFIKEALGLRKLSPGAVPTLNLGHNDTFNVYENELYTPPPPPQLQKGYYRQNNSLSMSSSSASNSFSSMFYAAESTSPFSSVTQASSTPNITESMDVCCVPGCESKRNNTTDITFHTIPRRPEQMQKWCHNLKMEEDKMHKGLRICSLHFESYCIGGCMRPFAVPTLNLGHNDDNIYKNPDVIKKLNIRETCCVQICKRNRERDHANLHRFPSNPVMMKKWCDNLHKPVPDGSRLFNDAICEVHFADRCLRNKRLEKWSVPTLKLGHDNLVHQLPTDAEVAELYARPSAPNNGDEEGECCVESCRRNPQIDDIKLYRTPEDPDKLAKWAHNLQIETEDLSNLRICNLHFESHCIGKRMHSWAIPTLNLGTNIENLFENPEQPLPIKKEKLIKFNTNIHSLKPTWVPRCCLPHCRKMRAEHNVHLFRFPSINRAMLAKWCHNLQVPLVGSAQRRVCSNHFNPDVLSKKCPIPNSVPTLDLNTPPGYKIYQNPARLKASKICMQRICIIDNCRKKRSDGVILFRFPNNHAVLRKWLHNIKQRPKGMMRAQCRICSLHFEPHSFHGKRLSNGAIPTLKLGHNDDDIYPNEARSFVDEQCVIQGCGATKEIPEVRLFRFPTDDEDHLWKWCNNLKMNPIDCRGVRICNKHFEPECIGPKHLFKWSIPTLALGHDDTEIELIHNPKPENRYAEIIFKCCVPNCGKTRKYDEVQMNSFPKELKQFRRWKHNLKLEYLDFKERDKYKICSTHFEDICIGKTRLLIGSIPTLNLGHNDTDLYKVRPEKLQRNLFGKHRPQVDSATSEDSNQYEEDIVDDKKEEITDYYLSNDVNEDEKLSEEEDPFVESSNFNLTQAKMKSSLDMLKCCVPSCRKSRLQHGIRLYSFPSGPVQLKKWSHNIQLSPTTQKSHLQICNLHFHKRCIDGKQLRPWAVPTMLLGHSESIYENPKNIPGFFLPVCALEHCRKRRTIDNDLRTYQFPKGLLLKKWCANLKLQPEFCRGRICADHFETEVRGKLKLKTGAVPTLKLGHDDSLLYDNEDIKTVLKKNHDSYEMHSQLSKDEVEHDSTTEADDDEDEFCDPLKFVETIDEQTEQDLDEKPPMETTIRREKAPNNVAPICCLKHCRKEKTAQHHLSTFGFPKNQELLYKWCANLKLDPDDCIGRVCIEHFDPEVVGSRKLKQGAVPTINIGHDEPLRYSNNGQEMSFELVENEFFESTKDLDSLNLESHYAQKLNHSVFRLCSLKHCRKRKTSEQSDKTNSNSLEEHALNLSERRCCVRNCGKTRWQEGVHLNRFPKKRIYYLKWAHNLQLKPHNFIVNSYKVCNEHFESYCLQNGFLKEAAVPTLKLGYGNSMIYRNPRKLRENLCVKEKKCFVPNCLCNYLNINKTYPLPTSKKIRLLWYNYFNVEQNLEDSKTYVCSLHFLHLYENAPLPKFMKSIETYILKEKYLEISNSASVQRLKCSVPGCQTKYIDNIRFTKLPSNADLCKKWLHNTKIMYNEQRKNIYHICLLHFEKDCIAYGRPKSWAIPTQHLNHNDQIFLNTNQSRDTSLLANSKCKELTEIGTPVKNKPINLIEQKTVSPKRTRKTCCIKKCNSQADEMRLFRFPTAVNQLQKWCVNTNQQITQVPNLYVCAKHFEPSAICKQQLRPWALPTLALEHDNFVIQNAKHLGDFHSDEQESEDMKYIRSHYCSVLCCFQKKSNAVRLYQYPSNMALTRKWAVNCKHRSFQASELGLQVCQQHFDDDCFEENGDLRDGAVPTLNLGFYDGEHILQSDWVETKRKTPISTSQQIIINCSAPNCVSISSEGMQFFKFPKTTNLLELWCKNLKFTEWNVDNNMYLCQLHFENHCITSNQRLHYGTLPTLLLGHNQTEDIIKNPECFERLEVLSECCVPKCQSITQDDNNDDVKLCSFPQFRSLFLKWAHNLKIPPNDYLWHNGKVCLRHFEDNCHTENGRVKSGAMPTLHLGHNDTNIHPTNPLTLGKRRKPQHFIRTATPSIQKMDFKCCFPDCKEYYHPKMKQDHDLPCFEPLRKQWCNLMGCDTQNTELRLCSLHYVINFEVTYDEFKNLQLQLGSENSMQNTLAEIEDTYYLAKSNSRVMQLSCVVPQCFSLLPIDNYRLYLLPQNRDLLEKWLHNIQIEVDDSRRSVIRICSQHFETRCYHELSKRLKVWAVPTLNLPELSEDKTLYENPTDEVLDKNNLKCCIKYCENSQEDIEVTIPLYSFPHESDILKKWVYNTQIKARDTFGSRICALHFEKHCIGRRLRKWAVPTLHLGHSLPNVYQNPSNKRLAQLKSETTAESEESRMSYLSDIKTETMDSSNLEPIVKMEYLEPCGIDDQSMYSQFSYEDQNNIFYNEDDLTNGSRSDSIDPAQMSLEVMLEVGHVEKCTTYEQGQSTQPNTPVSEQSLPSPSERNPNARRCCIAGCTASHKDVGIKLHKFPQSKIVLKKWMHNVQVEVDLRCPWRYRICSRHFENGCFNGHRFRYGTMPTLHLGPKRPAEIYENEFDFQTASQQREKEETQYISDNDETNEIENEESYGESEVNRIKSGKYCQVEGCQNHLHTEGVTLHKFPQLTRLWKKWQHNTQIPININYPWRFRVCSEHFHPQCLPNSRLLFGSVPTLNLGPKAPRVCYENEFHVNTELKVEKLEECEASENYDDDDDYDITMAIEPEIELKFNEESENEAGAYDNHDNVNDHLLDAGENYTKAGMTRCCIPGCHMNRAMPGITLHKYPNPPEHLQKWLHNTQVKVDLTCRWRYRVCNLHFEKSCFRGPRIVYGCVPTLNLGPNTPDFLYKNDEVFRRIETVDLTQNNAASQKPQTPICITSLNKLRCSVANCARFSGQDGVSLHRLPQVGAIREKWLVHCTNKPSAYHTNLYPLRICSKHFEKSCFMGPPGKRYLKPGVIPTLYLQNGKNNEFNEMIMEEESINSKVPQATDDNDFKYNEVKSGYGKCSLIHCQKQKSQHGVKIYKFPKSLQQQERWTHNLRICYDPKRPWKYLICSEHFEEKCVNKRKLYKWAVPTLNLGDNVPNILYTNDQCRQLHNRNDSSSDDSDNDDKPETAQTPIATNNNCQNLTNETIFDPLAETKYLQTLPTKSLFAYKTKICCLPHCRKPRGDGIKLFRLPTSVFLIRKWEHNTGISFNESQRNTKLICSKHFPSSLIGIRRLSKNAVPTLNLGPHAPINLHTNNTLEDEMNDDDSESITGAENEQTSIIESDNKLLQQISNSFSLTSPFIKQELDDWPKNVDMRQPPKNMTYKQHHCCVPHCGVARKGNLKLFRVPLDPMLRAKWEFNLSMKFDINDRNINLVCSRHFDPELVGATRLARGSVPTLHLRPNDSTQFTQQPAPRKDDTFNLVVCNVPGCDRTNEYEHIVMFNTLTRTSEILEKWCDVLQIDVDHASAREGGFNICSIHFEPHCFASAYSIHKWAVPTLMLTQDHSQKELSSISREFNERCSVPNCTRTGTQMFNFPTDKLVLKQWCTNLQIDDENNYRNANICSAHFHITDYNHIGLKFGAVPSLSISSHQTGIVTRCKGSTDRKCVVTRCQGSSRFYRFPENRNTCAKWCHNLKIDQLPNLHMQCYYRICDRHFESTCIVQGKLQENVVPTLNLSHDDPNIFINDNLAHQDFYSKNQMQKVKNDCEIVVKQEHLDFDELNKNAWLEHSWNLSDDTITS